MDVVLISTMGKELISVRALVDSGADCSMFPIEWASKLGINLKDCREEECATAGGPVTHYVYEPGISAMIEGRTHKLAATFSEHLSVVLLGRDLFMYYKITFDERAKKTMLEPYSARDAHSIGQANPRVG